MHFVVKSITRSEESMKNIILCAIIVNIYYEGSKINTRAETAQTI